MRRTARSGTGSGTSSRAPAGPPDAAARLPGRLRRCLCPRRGPVVQDDQARAEGPRPRQSQRPADPTPPEHPRPLAEQDRADADAQLVDQAVPQQ